MRLWQEQLSAVRDKRALTLQPYAPVAGTRTTPPPPARMLALGNYLPPIPPCISQGEFAKQDARTKRARKETRAETQAREETRKEVRMQARLDGWVYGYMDTWTWTWTWIARDG